MHAGGRANAARSAFKRETLERDEFERRLHPFVRLKPRPRGGRAGLDWASSRVAVNKPVGVSEVKRGRLREGPGHSCPLLTSSCKAAKAAR